MYEIVKVPHLNSLMGLKSALDNGINNEKVDVQLALMNSFRFFLYFAPRHKLQQKNVHKILKDLTNVIVSFSFDLKFSSTNELNFSPKISCLNAAIV